MTYHHPVAGTSHYVTGTHDATAIDEGAGTDYPVIDLDNQMVWRSGNVVHLTRTEWLLLEYLVRNAGMVLSHRMLLQHVWGDKYGAESHYLHTYVRRLRRKLEDVPNQPRYLVTEPGRGYRWNSLSLPDVPVTSGTPPSPQQPHFWPRCHRPLLGRDAEVDVVVTHIRHRSTQLLTLTGAPGIGKTRIALHVSEIVRSSFAHGCIFVDLSVLRDPAQVVPTIARVLGISDQESVSSQEQIQSWLAEKSCLLVFDNFEHMLPAAPIINDLLAVAPRLQILATSRAALRLSHEHEYCIQPLALPEPGPHSSLPAFAEIASVALFLERASIARPPFRLSHENAWAVAQICRQLDGVPLALELAAARLTLLPPTAILERLAHRFDLLTSGLRDAPPRHQSLWTALTWSYDLLPRESQRLFARLSVFVDGFTVEAVEAVVDLQHDESGSGQEELSILDGLTLLYSNNLIVLVPQDGEEPRFTMLATMREYALEQLATDDERVAVQRRHALYFGSLVEQASAASHGPQQTSWRERLDREHNNIRAALQWAIGTQTTELALRFVRAMWAFWVSRGYLREGAAYVSEALALPGLETSALRADALVGAGAIAVQRGYYQQATHFLIDSQALRQHLGDQVGVAAALINMGAVALVQEEYGRAQRLCEESLDILRRFDQPAHTVAALSNLGVAATRQHNQVYARRCLQECLALSQDIGDTLGVMKTWINLADMDVAQGHYHHATNMLRQAMMLAHQTGDMQHTIICITSLAAIAGLGGQPVRAAQLYGAGEALNRQTGFAVQGHDRAEYEARRADAERQLSPERWQEAYAGGQSMTLDDVVAYALQEDTSSIVKD